jgi:hypothetical protein
VLSLYAIETIEAITSLQNAAANADPLAVVLHATMLNSTVSEVVHTSVYLLQFCVANDAVIRCRLQPLLVLYALHVSACGASQVVTELQKAQQVQGIIIIDTPPPADAHVSNSISLLMLYTCTSLGLATWSLTVHSVLLVAC